MAMRSVVCWTLLGVALVDKMKGILGPACTFGPKAYNMCFPVSLVVVHMACSSCVSFIFVKPLTFPPISCRLYLSSVVPSAALSLSSSFSASIYLPVSFMRMIKAFTPVTVHSISILFKSETTRASSMVPYIIMIVVSIIIVACGKTELNARGLTLPLRLYPRPPVPSSFKSSHPKGYHFIPLDARLYYFAPCCLAFLLLGSSSSFPSCRTHMRRLSSI